jgi:hypothetical protein
VATSIETTPGLTVSYSETSASCCESRSLETCMGGFTETPSGACTSSIWFCTWSAKSSRAWLASGRLTLQASAASTSTLMAAKMK